ncbi:MAG TPA: winged helix DNA-binding domain-containing protein [Solirubrobacteraceae bacterium]
MSGSDVQIPGRRLRSHIEIAGRRLRNQRLAGAGLRSATDVVRWLGAVQSQIYPAARWSVGQRAIGLSAASIDDALAQGRVIRTHVLRPTWHLVSAEDIHWLLDLTAPRVQQRNATMYRKLGLDPPLLARADRILAGALGGGRQLTRAEIAAELDHHGVPTDTLRLSCILMHGELTQRLCSGARQGRQHTYALLEERAPRTVPLARDEALGELVRRYFTSHGPATIKDFSSWSSLTIADTRRGLEIAGGELEQTTVQDRTYWSASCPAPPAVTGAPRAHLLQGYDEYTVAYRDSRHVVDPARLAAVIPGRTARFTHNLVLDGEIIGHWRHATSGPPHVEIQLFRELEPTDTRAVDDAVRRYATFLGEPLSWSIP